MKAATCFPPPVPTDTGISIHAAREGGDECICLCSMHSTISIHAAREGGDFFDFGTRCVDLNISIHAAREGGDVLLFAAVPYPAEISIHAAREGGDFYHRLFLAFFVIISIHAAREGGDVSAAQTLRFHHQFQSTPPVKAATVCRFRQQISLHYFNPRRP